MYTPPAGQARLQHKPKAQRTLTSWNRYDGERILTLPSRRPSVFYIRKCIVSHTQRRSPTGNRRYISALFTSEELRINEYVSACEQCRREEANLERHATVGDTYSNRSKTITSDVCMRRIATDECHQVGCIFATNAYQSSTSPAR